MNLRFPSARSFAGRVALRVFVVGAVVMVLVIQQTLNATQDEVEEQVAAGQAAIVDLVAELSRPSLLTSDFGELQASINGLDENPQIARVDVVDLRGRVVASLDPASIGENLSEADRERGSHRSQETVIQGQSGVLGVVHVDFDEKFASAPVRDVRNRALVIGILGVAALAVAAMLSGLLVARRLAQVTGELGRVDDDGVPLPITVGGPDEIVALAGAVNTRTAALRAELEERRHVNAALHESQQRLALILDVTTDGMFEHELGSEAVTLVGGDTPEGLVPMDDLMATIHPDDIPVLSQAIAAHLGGSSTHFASEVRIQAPDGGWEFYSFRGRGLDPVDGVPTRLVGALVNVNRARELEREVAHVDKMRTLGRLVAGVTHDFNNILAVVHLNVDLLRRADRDQSLDAFRLSQISDVSDRASSVVEALLTLARPSTDTRVVVDLNRAVRSVAQTLRPLFSDRADIELQLEADPATVRIDRARAEQILLNLASNSHDAIRGHGTITIATRNTRRLGPEGGHGDEMLELTVSDDGTGIAPEVLDTLFDPFITTKPVGAGTGLGLTTTQETIIDAGGTIEARNRDDGGATVTVRLPVTQEHEAMPATEPELAPARGAGATVLVVDDQLEVLEVVASSLDRVGYAVLEALGPVEALDLATQIEHLDVLVTDVMMPGQTGPELSQAVLELHPTAKVLFMSGGRGIQDVIDPGRGVALIEKPFSAHALASEIAKLLDGEPSGATVGSG